MNNNLRDVTVILLIFMLIGDIISFLFINNFAFLYIWPLSLLVIVIYHLYRLIKSIPKYHIFKKGDFSHLILFIFTLAIALYCAQSTYNHFFKNYRGYQLTMDELKEFEKEYPDDDEFKITFSERLDKQFDCFRDTLIPLQGFEIFISFSIYSLRKYTESCPTKDN